MAKTPLGTLWTQRLKRADRERSERKDGWMAAALASDCHYKGNLEHDAHNGRPITKNKQYASTQTIHAAVLPNDIKIEVKPTRPMDTGPAKLMETLLRWNLHVANIDEVVEYVELDGQVKGVGISYISWATQAAPEDVDGEAALTGKDGEANESFIDAIENAMPHRLSHANLARIYHIDPYDFLIDPLATKMENARWAAHRMWLTKKEVMEWKKSGFFERRDLTYTQELWSSRRFARKNNLLEDIIGMVQEEEEAQDGMHDDDKADFKVWEVWQVFDFRKKEVLWIIPGMKEPARDPRPNPYGNPYQDYRPTRTGDTFWSKPESWLYAPAQLLLDEVTHSMAEITARMAKPGHAIAEEDAEEVDLVKLADLEPGEWATLPRNVLQNMKPLNTDFTIPPAMIQLQGSLEQTITEVSAVSETASGALVKGVTATANNLSAGGQSLRSGLKRRILDKSWVKNVAARVAFMLKKFFTQEMAIPVLGSKAALWGADEAPQTVAIKNEEIQGQFDYAVHAGDKAREVQVEERKMSMDLLQVAMSGVQMGAIPPEALQPVFVHVFELNDFPTDLIQQQQAPVVQPQLQAPGQQVTTSDAGGGPNSGRPTDSQGVPNPDQLNRDRAPAAGAIAGAQKPR